MFTVKECGNVAINTHLKIIRQDLKAFLQGKKETEKTMACLKQSTLGICIHTSISWQCKVLSKELWICFANEHNYYTHKSLKPHHSWFILFSDNIFNQVYIWVAPLNRSFTVSAQ